MLSFFTVLLILVGANLLFMALNLTGISSWGKKSGQHSAKLASSGIRTLKELKAKFKKAV